MYLIVDWMEKRVQNGKIVLSYSRDLLCISAVGGLGGF